MRKFMGLIVLMGQVRKERVRDYWSTDPTISTPIFPQVSKAIKTNPIEQK
jgi:hypothetical protein